jgi:hypothetical protein
MKARLWGMSRRIQVRQSKKLHSIISLTTCNHTTIKDRSDHPHKLLSERSSYSCCDVILLNLKIGELEKQLSSKRGRFVPQRLKLPFFKYTHNTCKRRERNKQYPNIEWFWTNLLKPWSRSMTIHYGELIPTSSNHFACEYMWPATISYNLGWPFFIYPMIKHLIAQKNPIIITIMPTRTLPWHTHT